MKRVNLQAVANRRLVALASETDHSDLGQILHRFHHETVVMANEEGSVKLRAKLLGHDEVCRGESTNSAGACVDCGLAQDCGITQELVACTRPEKTKPGSAACWALAARHAVLVDLIDPASKSDAQIRGLSRSAHEQALEELMGCLAGGRKLVRA